MAIKNFFHKVKMGFVRMCQPSIPHVSSAERYGNRGEEAFADKIEILLPDCKIKRNVIIDTFYGNAEIDCLILYQNKLFAIEVKRWKGRLTEAGQGFIQDKRDNWTGDVHRKRHQSPFRQLNRAINLLKRQTQVKAWVNAVVFFEGDECEEINGASDHVWFKNAEQLAEYVKNNGRVSSPSRAERFFAKCISADILHTKICDKTLRCIIIGSTFNFQTADEKITKSQISHITIEHHWTYDRLAIHLTDGSVRQTDKENAKVFVTQNGQTKAYALCKMDYIEIGR